MVSVSRLVYKIKSDRRAARKPRYSVAERIKKDIKERSAYQRSSRPIRSPTIDRIVLDIKKRQRDASDETKLNLGAIDSGYFVYINDDSMINPFGLNSEVARVINKETRNCHTAEDKARKLYDWFEDNISYGDSRRWTGYSTGQEVFRIKQGVCGEMAFLYTTMARAVGLKSNFYAVDRDHRNKKVCHACSGVETEQRLILVDPAYHTFDIKHKKYKKLTDKRIKEMVEQWRRS